MLENELANTEQGDLSISQFSLKIKNLYSEILFLDPIEPIFEAQVRRHIIRGLKKEYNLFVTSIQGWVHQPSLEEFENLLSSQESLAKQMAEIFITNNSYTREALFTHGKKNRRFEKKDFKRHDNDGPGESSSHYKKIWKCHRCSRPSHIKKFCNMKLNS